MMMIGSSVDYVRSGGMRNVPVTKAVEHLYATTAKFSGCVLLASRPAYSYPPRRTISDQFYGSAVGKQGYRSNRLASVPSDLKAHLISAVCSEKKHFCTSSITDEHVTAKIMLIEGYVSLSQELLDKYALSKWDRYLGTTAVKGCNIRY
ncbi:hypothetical protein AVEN_63489-1 [Araneus ventricosus]|uniref:Uncharacterized protein n=2 Tax=Araneus ventricosus TaxID=182803 RepID=A0A4Y2CRK5_ARAVE|nr:hypothetical protein AVEN_63489-1 [Araneus ventricosus]